MEGSSSGKGNILTVINEQWTKGFEAQQQLDLGMTFYHNQMASNSCIAFIKFSTAFKL